MKWVRLVVVVLGGVFAASACTKRNPLFCEADSECNNGMVCDLSTHGCVVGVDASTVCASNEQCPANAPVCRPDMACHKCALDDECGTRVCRSDGACEAAERVLYVSPNGVAAGQCPSTSPCELFYARSLLTSERSTIRLDNGTYVLGSDFEVTGAITNLTIVGGRAAIIQRPSAGWAFEVGTAAAPSSSILTIRGITINKGVRCDTASLTLTGVAFDNAPSETLPWVDARSCDLDVTDSELNDSLAEGIVASAGTTTITRARIDGSASHGVRVQSAPVTIRSSTISNNAEIGVTAVAGLMTVERSKISGNRRGGLSSVSGTFDVTNNFVVYNGDPSVTSFGGMRLESSSSGNRVQHNTVARNDCDVNATPVLAGGVYCVGAVASNNLVVTNYRGNTTLPSAQVGGSCDFSASYVSETPINGMFRADGMNMADGFHLDSSTSPVVNAGIASGVTVDIDGQARSDGMPDLGADELDP